MSEPQFSIVLPVCNQADHIAEVVRGYVRELKGLGHPFEIVLVPNGSRDNTNAVCAELAKEFPDQVQSLEISGGGWGRAVRAGVKASRGKWIGYTNTARTRAEDLKRIMGHALACPGNVVKAARVTREKVVRRLGSLIYNLECNLLFGLLTHDINGTPKIFPREFSDLIELERDDDLIDLEFLWRCRRAGYPLVEVPVYEGDRHSGRSTTGFKSAWRMYSGALRYWRVASPGSRPA